MGITAGLTFITSLFVLALLAGIGLFLVNSSRGRPTRLGVILALVGLIGIIVAVPLNAGLVLIQPNERGVVFRQTASGDAALREPLDSGLKWVVPFIDQVQKYDVGRQSVDMVGGEEAAQSGSTARPAVRAISKDGQQINLDITVIFHIDPAQVNNIHRNWRVGYVDGYVVPQTRSEVRNAVNQYGAEEIYAGGRAALEALIVEKLQPKLSKEGLILDDLLIRDISFSEQFTQAIEQKQIAEQQAQQAAFGVQRAQQEAEQARVEAQGRSDSAVIAAEGQAEATVLQAQAEAESLALINEILSQNPYLIQYRYIDELGDNIRLIIVPSNTPFLFDLQQLLAQAGVDPTTTLPTPVAPPTNDNDNDNTSP
jgi:regulator of protease activity HflC (stomatin/prohibitin superfamily)